MTSEFGLTVLIRLAGSLAGAALALITVPPRTWRGFFYRLAAAMIFGPSFAYYVQAKLGFDAGNEGLFSASCLTAFASWPATGAILRAVRYYGQTADR